MNISNMIKRHEGAVVNSRKQYILYKCPAGKLTIGWGHNIEDNGLPEHVVQVLLEHDIINAEKDLDLIFDNWRRFAKGRRLGLTSMMFNLGHAKFRKFRKMIKAIRDKKWEEAADEAMLSLWSKQVKSRAEEISSLFRSG